MLGDRWGVTDAEMRRAYPCDAFVPQPVLQAWRGVTVHAPTSAVWPWLVQIRLAPYSYDWLDNLGHRSPQQLKHLPDPQPGEPFTATGGRPQGRVLGVEHEQHLTGTILGVVMSYVLEPDGEHTRLLMKLCAARGRWVAPLLSVGDLVMARRQLLNLKCLAESG